MNIDQLLEKENKKIKDYYDVIFKWYDFSGKNLISLEGLPDDFNNKIYLNDNKLKNLQGLPEGFNARIFLRNNPIENLDGLNNVLNINYIIGLDKDFIFNEYRRLGKYHLLI